MIDESPMSQWRVTEKSPKSYLIAETREGRSQMENAAHTVVWISDGSRREREMLLRAAKTWESQMFEQPKVDRQLQREPLKFGVLLRRD